MAFHAEVEDDVEAAWVDVCDHFAFPAGVEYDVEGARPPPVMSSSNVKCCADFKAVIGSY